MTRPHPPLPASGLSPLLLCLEFPLLCQGLDKQRVWGREQQQRRNLEGL